MNEIELSNNLELIEEEIEFHSHRTKKSLWEIGRRLKHVKDNDLAHGQFMNWYESIGFNKNFVSRAITIAEEFTDFPTVGNISNTALYLIATLPNEQKEEELKKAEGGEPSTTRELQEIKRKNREQQKTIEEQQKIINEQANQKPKIVEKEVTKEVVPHDYDGLKSDIQQLELSNRQYRKQIEDIESRNKTIEKQYYDLLEQRKEVDEKSKKYDELNQAIQEMQGRMDEGQKNIKAQKDVYDLVRKANELIVEVAPLTYLIDTENVLKNEYAQKPIKKIINNFREMADRLEKTVSQEILEGEIVNE